MPYALEATADVVKLIFHGDLDISRYEEVGKALQLAADHEPRPVLIVLDESVQYVDSFTFSEVLMFRRRLQAKFRRVALHTVSANIYRMLVLADVAERLNASMSERDALATLLR